MIIPLQNPNAFVAWFPWSASVNAARTTHLDIFNASDSGKRVIINDIRMSLATTGIPIGAGVHWEMIRTTSVGTGGTAVTFNPLDTTRNTIPSQITGRQKPTGGASSSVTLMGITSYMLETATSSPLKQLNSVIPVVGIGFFPLVLQEGQGLKVDQITATATGSIGWVFSISLI